MRNAVTTALAGLAALTLPACGRVPDPVDLLRAGDRIRIDFPNRQIDILVSEEELTARRAAFQPVTRELRGWLARYQKLVSNASQGGVLAG